MLKKIATSLLVLAVLGGIVFVGRTFLISSNQLSVEGDSNLIDIASGEEINVLIMGKVGQGQGGLWHSAPDLVDTIFLVNLNPELGKANLISLPRDLYGDFGDSRIRLNRILYDHKIGDFLELLPDLTGFEVQEYLVVDLDTVGAIVDNLGGIDVELKEDVIDPVGGSTLRAGKKRLDGEEALWLIRNRFAPEGDFFRERNQHLVVEAIFNKFDGLSTVGKTAFAFKMLPYISKSEANFDAGSLLADLKKLEDISFNSVVLDFSTKLLDTQIIEIGDTEAYVLVPKEGINQYAKIRECIQEKAI